MSFRAPLSIPRASPIESSGSSTSAQSGQTRRSDPSPPPQPSEWWADDWPSISASTSATTAPVSSGARCATPGAATRRSSCVRLPLNWEAQRSTEGGESRCMTQRERDRHEFRKKLLRARGLSPEEAEAWANRLTHRDADLDDRRLCEECEHCTPRGCGPVGHRPTPGRRAWLVLTLQRCPDFKWKIPT